MLDAQRNMDARAGLLAAAAAPFDLQRFEVDQLRAAMPDLRVEFDSTTGATRSLWNVADYLTPPDGRSPLDIAEDFVVSRVSLLGLTDSDLVDMELTDQVYSSVSGVTHLYFRQRVNGIPLYNAQLHVNVTRDGRILSVNNAFLPNLTASIASLRPALTAAAAVRAVGAHLGVPDVVPVVESAEGGARQTTGVSAPALSSEPITVQLMVLPVARGRARLVWNFQIATLDGRHVFDLTVDAETGQVWTRVDWVAADAYRVYPRPVESPNHTAPAPPSDGRALVSAAADPTASPFGWHDTDGATGAEFTTTAGNNVHAYVDANNDDAEDGGDAPDCGPDLNCDFNIDLAAAPTSYAPAAAANLFYWNNVVHDLQYRYGFDEPAGSFQTNNYGRGGLGGDSVRAEAQDSAANPQTTANRNNANFLTPPDGMRPRMQMYAWTYSTPHRDGDLDAGIVVHEYGHGISNRQVGGPAEVSCLANRQQPGEGISDWLSLVYTALPGHSGATPRGLGTYALGQPPTGPGIRTQRYSTDNTVNDWTYASISSGTLSVPHGVGAVWAQGMWEVYWALVDQYGFSSDLYDATGGAGNQRAMLYHNEGLKNTACNPGFTQVRDGIIQAAQTLHGGADVCRLWTAFAAFGLGADAVNPSPASIAGIVNGFNTPVACGGTPVPTAVNDSLTTTYPSGLLLPAPGVLGNDSSNGGGVMTAVLVSNPANGTLTLGASGSVSYTPNFGFVGTDSFTYRAQSSSGAGNVATVTITVAPPTTVQAPYNLRVDSVVGTTVTLRWDALPIGPQASTFVLEGGFAPGEVVASIPTGSAAPIFTFTAPNGSFSIRMHGQLGADKSAASNEVPLHVGVPVTPSAPATLLGLVNASTLDLTWKNTFGGGPATALILDVTGSAALSLPMGVTERFSFTPVPGGTYTFRVRQANAGGVGPASDPVTLSFPSGCTGAPQAPTNFLGYRIGATGFVVWDPPASGAAPTGYVLDVSGSFVGSFGTAGRALSGAIAPGSYNVRVQAVNACGASPFTPAQVISLP